MASTVTVDESSIPAGAGAPMPEEEKLLNRRLTGTSAPTPPTMIPIPDNSMTAAEINVQIAEFDSFATTKSVGVVGLSLSGLAALVDGLVRNQDTSSSKNAYTVYVLIILCMVLYCIGLVLATVLAMSDFSAFNKDKKSQIPRVLKNLNMVVTLISLILAILNVFITGLSPKTGT